MTFSIVARDPASGALGVAVQSCFLGVGAIVPFTRPGVGAVATQAFTDPAYGPRCLDALAAGASAAEALDKAAAADPAAFLRQVGVVGADASVAAHTGAGCIDHAGHRAGEGFAVQANMMASPSVWPAMADAYATATGPLPRRLLAALGAAQAAGGDARGVMSAADGYDRFNRATDALFGGDPHAALAHVEQGLAILPGDPNLVFLRAAALLGRGDTDRGRHELRSLLASHPSWEVIIRGFAARGLLRLPAGTSIDALIGV